MKLILPLKFLIFRPSEEFRKHATEDGNIFTMGSSWEVCYVLSKSKVGRNEHPNGTKIASFLHLLPSWSIHQLTQKLNNLIINGEAKFFTSYGRGRKLSLKYLLHVGQQRKSFNTKSDVKIQLYYYFFTFAISNDLPLSRFRVTPLFIVI